MNKLTTLVLLEFGNGEKHISLVPFLDILKERAILHANEASSPGLDLPATNLVRGQRLEILLLIKGLTELALGTTEHSFESPFPSFQSPSGAE